MRPLLGGSGGRACLFVCDVQERFRPLIHRFPAVLRSSRALIKGATALSLQVVVTEQNPTKLGSTVHELAPLLAASRSSVFAKMRFSMCTPEVLAELSDAAHVVLCGIEAHVCVAQTAYDLLERGVAVHVVVDGVSSQRAGDRAVALAALAAAGASLTTTEAVLFALLGGAEHKAFKDVQRVAIDFASETRDAPPGEGLDALA